MSTRFYRPVSPEQAARLPKDEPYLECIYDSDWTQGHNHMLHCHSETAEVLLIRQGHGWYSIGAHRSPVQAGDLILCGSGVPHDEFPGISEPYRTLCFAFRRWALPGLPAGQFLPETRAPILHEPAEFAELAALADMLMRHTAPDEPGEAELCLHLTRSVLALLRRMLARETEAALPAQDALIVRILRYIDAHYAEDITIERLGRLFYVSPFHLSHLFKQRTGYTLKQYILRRRIGEAQTRLFATGDSIQRIAADVGFEDAGYFSRLFAKYVGMPPVEYRKWMDSRA